MSNPMTQFKVGDRVRVITDIGSYKHWRGIVSRVKEINEYPYKIIFESYGSCCFKANELELLPSPKSRVTLKPEYQEITATLKNGYIKLGRNLVIPAEYVDIISDPEPESYYSGTIVCGYCEDGNFTEHKAYEVKDGVLRLDDGLEANGFRSVKEINKAFDASSFFELIPAEVNL